MLLSFKTSNFDYTRQGNGKAIVLLHGFLENQTMWEPFLSVLSENHTVITIDLPGHGKSDCIGYIHSMELMADVVEAILKKENINSTKILGHSMGGYAALAFAERHPEMCAEIVLLNSTPKADSEERKENRDRAIALVKKHKDAFLSMAIANLFAEKNKSKFSAEIESLKKDALKMKTQGIIAALEGMKIRKDRTHLLKKLKVPKTIIAGTLDPIMPLDDLEKIALNCNCQFIKWEGGHMSTIENNEDFLLFLKGIPTSRF
jgi:pimeloyl-ACP methyl ester carboxylesterase